MASVAPTTVPQAGTDHAPTGPAEQPLTHRLNLDGVRADLERISRQPAKRPAAWNVNLAPPERLGSTLLGAALTGFGLSRRSILGVILAALGVALVERGATGHCAIKRQVRRAQRAQRG